MTKLSHIWNELERTCQFVSENDKIGYKGQFNLKRRKRLSLQECKTTQRRGRSRRETDGRSQGREAEGRSTGGRAERMGNSPEETKQTTATDTASSACRRKRMTGYTSQSPYHEEKSDSEGVDDKGDHTWKK